MIVYILLKNKIIKIKKILLNLKSAKKTTMTAETKASESFKTDLKEILSLQTGMSLFCIKYNKTMQANMANFFEYNYS